VVGVLRNGPGPVVMLRTELDALPMEEKTGLPYASRAQQTVEGKLTFVDHACGHDSHMAWWVGTAKALAGMKSQWHGTLIMVGQPAEEVVSGAKAMLDDGLYTRFPKPDYAFAAHIGSAPAGEVSVKQGATTSASDSIVITFHGQGAHGSMPDKSIDPIVMGARFVEDVQTVISRQKDPQKFGVVTVGSFHAGTVGNIIPDTAQLALSLRSYEPAVRKLLVDGVGETARAVAQMSHAPAPDVVRIHGTAPVLNDPALAARAAGMLTQALGKDRVTLVPTSEPGWTASEDFSEYTAAGVAQTTFFSVGGYDPAVLAKYKAEGKPVPVNHSLLRARSQAEYPHRHGSADAGRADGCGHIAIRPCGRAIPPPAGHRSAIPQADMRLPLGPQAPLQREAQLLHQGDGGPVVGIDVGEDATLPLREKLVDQQGDRRARITPALRLAGQQIADFHEALALLPCRYETEGPVVSRLHNRP
jgi:hippurate hydrolase